MKTVGFNSDCRVAISVMVCDGIPSQIIYLGYNFQYKGQGHKAPCDSSRSCQDEPLVKFDECSTIPGSVFGLDSFNHILLTMITHTGQGHKVYCAINRSCPDKHLLYLVNVALLCSVI